jgi:hypothetical protein
MSSKTRPRFRVEVEAPANGRVGKATFTAVDQSTGKVCYTDKADLASAPERKKAVARMVEKLQVEGQEAEGLEAQLDHEWHESIDRRRRLRQQAAEGSAEAAPDIRSGLLDAQPPEVRRPLCLVAGRAYAAAWCPVQTQTYRTVDVATGKVSEHKPPLVSVETRLVIIRDDGTAFVDGGGVRGCKPLAELGLPVRLAAPVAVRSGWTGAGLKRYVAGERTQPAEVFARLVAAVDHFLDFSRSLAPQPTMCQLVAAYALATWFLDAFNVVGYLWPNGEPGSGKTTLLQLMAEGGYLGELILAGSSYPTLRDLADNGATLAFDDAENVMDPKRSDPDKRTLLLAGNRRGATVAVKEQQDDAWVTRHVNTFCPRLFSAIRLPDGVLGSRSIIVPLVRSGDAERTKRSVADPDDWPCDRRRLVDDLWALGLAHLPELPGHDREAAAKARLSGRALEPWRAILGVAHWLEAHGVEGLFARLEVLSWDYQQERGEYEEHDTTRVLFRALLRMTPAPGNLLQPADIAKTMNGIAKDEDLAEADKDFTNPRRVGWLLKRQRFKRGERTGRGKCWEVNRDDVERAARAHGIDLDKEGDPLADEQPF